MKHEKKQWQEIVTCVEENEENEEVEEQRKRETQKPQVPVRIGTSSRTSSWTASLQWDSLKTSTRKWSERLWANV